METSFENNRKISSLYYSCKLPLCFENKQNIPTSKNQIGKKKTLISILSYHICSRQKHSYKVQRNITMKCYFKTKHTLRITLDLLKRNGRQKFIYN